MVVLTNLIACFPILLILHCLCIFLFKRWLGPVGTFYGSIFIFCICLVCAFNDLYFILLNGNYFFVDFGR